MPELPEVETVVRDLAPMLIGKRVTRVCRSSRVDLRIPWEARWNDLLVGNRIRAVDRRGKWIILSLEGGLFLVIHLGMTGQLQVKPSSQSPADHTHLIFHLEPGTDQLHFRDIRRFGSAQVFTGRDDLHRFFDGGRLGPEPFGLDPTRWRDSLKKSTRAIKAVLLDQGVVAGVGNIYADESLFLSRIHPATRSCDLSPKEAETLRRAIEEVLTFAIEKRGSTIRNYVGGSGLSGGYQDEFRAYGRGGEPCNRCATPIEVMRLAGRASHFCPRCQKVKPGRSPCSSRKS